MSGQFPGRSRIRSLVHGLIFFQGLPQTLFQSPNSSFLIPHSEFQPLLHELAAALESQKTSEIDRLLDELNQKALDSAVYAEIKEPLEQISDHVLMAEFESAREIVRSLLKDS